MIACGYPTSGVIIGFRRGNGFLAKIILQVLLSMTEGQTLSRPLTTTALTAQSLDDVTRNTKNRLRCQQGGLRQP